MDIMPNSQARISDFEALLLRKEQELLAQQEVVSNFLETTHTSKETEEFQTAVQAADMRINGILKALLEHRDAATEFRDEVTSLCQRCRELKNYTRDMKKDLADDFAKRQRAEEKNEVDVVKNFGFMIAIIGGFTAGAKAGFGDETVSSTQAAGAGAAVGGSILCRKRIKEVIKTVGRSLCETPQQIRDSFWLAYARETLKETRDYFRTSGNELGRRNSVPSRRTDNSNQSDPKSPTPEP